MTKQSLELKRKYCVKNGLEDVFSEELLSSVNLHRFAEHEYICHKGQAIDYFHIILEGRCSVIPFSESGKQFIMSYIGPVSFIGDIEFFIGCDALHSVKAKTNVITLAITREIFFGKALNSVPFLQLICKSLAEKVYSSSLSHSSNMLFPINSRLSSLLLELSKDQQSSAIVLNMNETALLLGISTRHLRRVIKSFEDEGIIRRESRRVVILNEQALRDQIVS
ncbi:MAG: Crp/Fnr family transcriptional regulator [Saccharofermentanales bacterium]|jgi:CRP-like cAMP-binding protein